LQREGDFCRPGERRRQKDPLPEEAVYGLIFRPVVTIVTAKASVAE
jgi:hypothetical protein